MREVKPIDDDKLMEFESELKNKNNRDYILFLCGICLGLRISDILKLKVVDVYKKDSFYIQEQKTGKYKEVPIPNKLKKELNVYCKDKRDYEYLFKSRQGFNKPIKRNRAYRILRETGEKIGLERIGTHSMRKTFGRRYYEKYEDIEGLRVYLNHSNVSTTRRYIGLERELINNNIRELW